MIDPAPVIGPPLYDFIYAFFSSPDDLTKETFGEAARYLMTEEKLLYEEVMIGLYIRLGTCMKHYPGDFEDYVKAWYDWKSEI